MKHVLKNKKRLVTLQILAASAIQITRVINATITRARRELKKHFVSVQLIIPGRAYFQLYRMIQGR